MLSVIASATQQTPCPPGTWAGFGITRHPSLELTLNSPGKPSGSEEEGQAEYAGEPAIEPLSCLLYGCPILWILKRA